MNAVIALCHFCEKHASRVLFCTQTFHESTCKLEKELQERGEDSDGSSQSSQSSKAQTDECQGCRSLPHDSKGLFSHDKEARVKYISTRQPRQTHIRKHLRMACFRSLSCEETPNDEGVIFYGDQSTGYVLAYKFSLSDIYARGLKRCYSILVFMMDKVFLLNSWPFLEAKLKEIVNDLKASAEKVFEFEKNSLPARNNTCEGRRRTNPVIAERSLMQLVSDHHVLVRLHQSFTWLLQAGAQRLQERVFEGPPTEEAAIVFEKEEETEEGFVKLFSEKVSVQEDTAVTDEFVSDDSPYFVNLRQLLKALEPQSFAQVAHHLLVGNQLVIRGSERRLIRSIIDQFKVLLPRGCCKPVYYSNQYLPRWQTNMVGLRVSTAIPPDTDGYIVIDILQKPAADSGAAAAPATSWTITRMKLPARDDVTDPSLHYKFFTGSASRLPDRQPTILSRIMTALTNDRLPQTVLEKCLFCVKEEMMNKVKVLFKFTKAGGNRSEEVTRKLLTVVGVQDSDKPVVKFFMTGLSQQYQNHLISAAIIT